MADQNDLQVLVAQSGLEQSKAQVVLSNFSDIFEIAALWEKRAAEIHVTSAEDVGAIKLAREGRLILKQKRVDVEKTRKTLKEDSLREGRLIDGIAKVLSSLIEPIEKDLEEKEKFVEIQQEKQEQALRNERGPQIQAYGVDPTMYDLGRMPQQQFEALMMGFKAKKDQDDATAKKAEEDRIAREAEDKRVREENEQLKKEAEARDREAAKSKQESEERERKLKQEAAEREKAIAFEQADKLRLEREAREKVERELREKQQAEENKLSMQAAAEKKLKRSSDKTKLNAYADALQKIAVPEVKSDEAQAVVNKVLNVIPWIRKEAEKL